MNLKELAKKLDRISELQAKIEGEVRDTYKEHGELTAEVSLEIAARKGKELLGIPVTALSITLGPKQGLDKKRTWILSPNFVRKDGTHTNMICKPQIVHAYSVVERKGADD
jgi:hypothetical protein